MSAHVSIAECPRSTCDRENTTRLFIITPAIETTLVESTDVLEADPDDPRDLFGMLQRAR